MTNRELLKLRNIVIMVGVGALLYTAYLRSGGVRVYFASDPQNLVEAGHYRDGGFLRSG